MGSLNGMSREAGNSYLLKETEMYRHLTNEELTLYLQLNGRFFREGGSTCRGAVHEIRQADMEAEVLERLRNKSAQLTPSAARNTP